jgi:hypothetical protein
MNLANECRDCCAVFLVDASKVNKIAKGYASPVFVIEHEAHGFNLFRCHLSWFGLVWLDVEVMGKVLALYAPVKCDWFARLRCCIDLLVHLQSPRGDLQNKLEFRDAFAGLG